MVSNVGADTSDRFSSVKWFSVRYYLLYGRTVYKNDATKRISSEDYRLDGPTRGYLQVRYGSITERIVANRRRLRFNIGPDVGMGGAFTHIARS